MKPPKKNRLFFRVPPCYHCLKRYWLNQLYPRLSTAIRKSLSLIDPLKLSPLTIIFWYPIPPYKAIGLSITGLEEIAVFGRQQIEPNQTLYVMSKILHLKPPFPLTLFIMFVSFSLVLVDSAHKVILSILSEYENNAPTDETITPSLDPFALTPRMSIYYPIFDDRTSIGFLTIDSRHVEISVKQALEPNNNIRSLIRFIDIYSPYPLQVAVMILSFGLFLSGIIMRYNQEIQQEVIDDIQTLLRGHP